MRRDPHEARKDFIESEMIAGRNPKRIMREPIRTTVDILRARFPQPDKIQSHNLIHQAANELEKALERIIQLEATALVVAKHSNRDRDRIIELENELAEARKPSRIEKLIEQDKAIDALNQIIESKTI